MKKKRRPVRKKKRIRRKDAYKMESILDEAGRYADAIGACNAVLAVAPPRSKQRVEALTFKANALSMLKRFDEAYDALPLAVEIAPDKAYLWYNKGMASLYTSRVGEAVLDLRRAVELESDGEMADKLADALADVERLARSEQEMRGPDFTLEQLIEQQTVFRQAMDIFQAGEWEEAERYFRQVIEMGDCLPQPWANLGVCLLISPELFASWGHRLNRPSPGRFLRDARKARNCPNDHAKQWSSRARKPLKRPDFGSTIQL